MAKKAAKGPQDPQLLELARRGAQAQLNDLIHEIEMLLELFPHLKDNFDPDELPVSFLLKRGADRARAKLTTQPRPRVREGGRTAKGSKSR